MSLHAPMQARYSHYTSLAVDGQFADQRDLQPTGKSFTVFGRGARYSIDIRDDRVELTQEDAIKRTDGESTPPKH